MTEYHMTHILAQAMDGEVGEALRQYFDNKFQNAVEYIMDNEAFNKLPALTMIREIKREIYGMKNTLQMMSKE